MLPGDRLYCRDIWGIPQVFWVDLRIGPWVTGMSGRGSFVRVLAGACAKTLEECERSSFVQYELKSLRFVGVQ